MSKASRRRCRTGLCAARWAGLLTDLGDELLNDWRTGRNTQHTMVALMRQSLFSRLAGYEDTHDAERLPVDPTNRADV
jgi:hypothetical protein